MATGKYLSLEEARKDGKLKRFAKEHPSEGDVEAFDALLDAMAHGAPPDSLVKARKKREADQTSGKD